MKLYVWNDPYSVPFGGSIVYAVAANEDDARKVASVAPIRPSGIDGIGESYMPKDVILGPPDRVLDIPCAEIYEWSE